jgi:hypothetical protein
MCVCVCDARVDQVERISLQLAAEVQQVLLELHVREAMMMMTRMQNSSMHRTREASTFQQCCIDPEDRPCVDISNDQRPARPTMRSTRRIPFASIR